jgi:hypothetical protein
MHEVQILLGQVAALLAIIQVVPYIRSILRGETKPSRASYAIWLCVELVLVASYFSSGATTTKWMFVIILLNSVVLFLLSLKYGMKGFHKVDLFSIVFAMVAIIAWITTDNPALAVYLCAAASFFGYIPTERKTYTHPKTENKLSWGLYVLAAFLNVCALDTLELAIILPPLTTLIMSTSIYLLLQKNFNKSLHHHMIMRMHTSVPRTAK